MEHRIQQLELKLAEQEQANAALREDIKSLKEIQNGDREEYRTGFDHYEQKKKKFSGLLSEVIKITSALQGQQERLSTKAELQYVSHSSCNCYQTGLTFARLLSVQLDDLKYGHATPGFLVLRD
jgi:hypothetical protein